MLKRIPGSQQAKRQIVYLDESGFADDRPGRNGYALVGTRCAGKHNWYARGRINVIGAWLASCLLTVSLFSGTRNADTFYVWVEQDLFSRLPPKRVMVLDNATCHKRADIQLRFELAGHQLEYLPSSSPDLNPIEHKWDQAKAIRKQKFCSVEDLFKHYIS